MDEVDVPYGPPLEGERLVYSRVGTWQMYTLQSHWHVPSSWAGCCLPLPTTCLHMYQVSESQAKRELLADRRDATRGGV